MRMLRISKTFLTIVHIIVVISISSGTTNSIIDNTTFQTSEISTTSDHQNNSGPVNGSGGKYDNSMDEYSETLMHGRTGSIIFLIVVGLAGNSLTILVTIKQGLIKTAVWVHIMCLAISDNCVLLAQFLYEFSKEPVNYWGHFLHRNDFICKLYFTCYTIFLTASHTILAFMTIQRSITIINPYKEPPGQKRGFIMVAYIIIYVMVLYVPYGVTAFGVVGIPIGMDYPLTGQPSTIQICRTVPWYTKFHEYFLWADTLIMLIIPAMSIIIANVAIIVTLIKRSKNKNIQRDTSKVRNDSRINHMLVFVSSYFVFSVSPMIIYVNYLPQYVFKDLTKVDLFASDNVAWSIITYLNMTNYVANFFMYCLTGQIFREETKKVIYGIFKCNRTGNNVQNLKFQSRTETASTSANMQ